MACLTNQPLKELNVKSFQQLNQDIDSAYEALGSEQEYLDFLNAENDYRGPICGDIADQKLVIKEHRNALAALHKKQRSCSEFNTVPW